MALALAVILEHALRDLLVVRVVPDACRHQCQALDEQRAVFTAVKIGLGPGDGLRRVERGDRRLQIAR